MICCQVASWHFNSSGDNIHKTTSSSRCGDEQEGEYSPRPTLPVRSTPWVVLPHGRHKQIQTFFNPIDGSLHHRSIPEMRHRRCLGCSNGWLLIQHDSGECFLVSIASMKTVSLPPLLGLPDYPITFTLSPPSSSSDHLDPSGCTAVLVVGKQIIFCRIHEEEAVAEWTKRKVDGLAFTECLSGGAAWLNGKLYLDTNDNSPVVVDFSSPVVSVNMLSSIPMMIYMLIGPVLKQGLRLDENDDQYVTGLNANSIKLLKSTSTYRQTLVESCGEILSVIFFLHRYNDTVIKVEVFKLDISNSEWERLVTIGNDQAIFVGECGTACTVKDERVEGNCVYFVQPSYDGMRWYKFSLTERSLSYTLFYPGLRKTWQNSFLAMTAT
ncbi:uncharacterized protein A4U43_C06F3030 [Asparagus officinalis]|uniref:KIB1-4 beta-propeller domain-containing protein n=1 Tax=Asparagus officinalis TaxID=4686 RepID=A0A5P1EJ42_ASPOF|nr:uncharacterized protein A4U43_C06F3030 [Asparagus officinalis]